ncbi:MAG: hypothetical protein NWE83_07245 [Candidatus Bathyarchaeota archaeon]|jgi:hypothetical protein|nr:hypothetical protein [Candidatus Bathyarchaeota archaeon]
MSRKRSAFEISSDILRARGIMKKPLSAELLHGLRALKKQGFDVFFTSDRAAVIVHIRKNQS